MKKVIAYLPFIKFSFYLIVPSILLILPVDYFDTGHTICLSVNLLGVECFACGMTSAMMHIIHLDFETAFAYNMLSLIAFPVLSLAWLKWAYDELRNIRKILGV